MAFTDEDKAEYIKGLYKATQKLDEKSSKELLFYTIEKSFRAGYDVIYEEMCEECKEALKKKYIVKEA